MKKFVINSLLFAVTAGLLIMSSCKDKFTEEDLLNAQQELDYTVHVMNANSEATDTSVDLGISEATVTINQAGKSKTKETDESGNAVFKDVKIGQVVVKVEADSFTKVTFSADLQTYNAKVGQATTMIPLFPTNTSQMATIKGKAEIETDLTNNTPELVPQGTEIRVVIDWDDLDDVFNYVNWPSDLGEVNSIKYQTFSTTVDENGMYEIKVPALKDGLPLTVIYPVLDLDQSLAYLGDDDYFVDEFPTATPSVGSMSTTFGYSSGTQLTVPDIEPVYAVIDATADTIDDAIIDVDISEDGEILSVQVIDAGTDYSDTIEEFSVTITSLAGGSGGEAFISTNVGGDFPAFTNADSITPGSGYPYEEDLPGKRTNINYCYYEDGANNETSYWGFINGNDSNVPDPQNADVTVSPGEIVDGDIYYGVGTGRAQEINENDVPN